MSKRDRFPPSQRPERQGPGGTLPSHLEMIETYQAEIRAIYLRSREGGAEDPVVFLVDPEDKYFRYFAVALAGEERADREKLHSQQLGFPSALLFPLDRPQATKLFAKVAPVVSHQFTTPKSVNGFFLVSVFNGKMQICVLPVPPEQLELGFTVTRHNLLNFRGHFCRDCLKHQMTNQFQDDVISQPHVMTAFLLPNVSLTRETPFASEQEEAKFKQGFLEEHVRRYHEELRETLGEEKMDEFHRQILEANESYLWFGVFIQVVRDHGPVPCGYRHQCPAFPGKLHLGNPAFPPELSEEHHYHEWN